MLQLLWILLNVFLFVGFFFIAFKAVKLVKEKLGLFASVVFVIGLLSFMSGPSEKKKQVADDPSAWKLQDPESRNFRDSEYAQVELESNLLAKRYLQMIYGTVKGTDTLMVIKAWSGYDGLIAGTNWKPTAIVINQTSNLKEVSYEVHGEFEWNLLNINIFSETEVYKGKAILKPSEND